MLRGIHKASSTWLGKAVMGTIMLFLIVSFAVWGIGDIFRGGGRNEVAKIGGTEITTERFRQYYNERLRQVSQQLRRPITPDQARGLGLDRQFLGQLIAEATLSEKARDMRLGISDAEVASRIRSDPSFRGPNGQFDPSRFAMILNQAGFSEARFVAEQREVTLRRQIAQSVSLNLRASATALEVVDRYRNQKRNVDYLTLGPAQAGDVAAPTPEQLSQYFEERKALFRAPEYRKITVLTLSPAELAKPDAVSDADAKAYYEQRKAQYGKPEKREIRQIIFPKAEDAAAARDKIAKGASFDDIVKERELKPEDTVIGMVAKTDLIDPAVAEAAFSLKPGEVSQPVAGRFGTVLLTVGKVEAGEQKSYEEVASQIKQEIATAQARSKLGDLRDKIEDEKASGATLAETAKKLGLTSTVYEAVDRSGRGPDGNPIAGLPKTPDVVASAFATDVGVDNEALQLPNGGFLYFDLAGVTPSHERKLDDIKPQVEASWRDDQISQTLQKKADDLLAKIKAGTTLEQAASEAGVTVQKAIDLQRGRAAPNVPASVVDDVFKTAKDAAGTAIGQGDTQRFVYRVTQITDPALDSSAVTVQQVKTLLQNSYSDDLVGEYLARLESDYKVSINQSALNQVVGGSTEQ